MLRCEYVTATKDIVAFLATEKSTWVDATGLGSLLAQMKGGHYMRKMFKKL